VHAEASDAFRVPFSKSNLRVDTASQAPPICVHGLVCCGWRGTKPLTGRLYKIAVVIPVVLASTSSEKKELPRGGLHAGMHACMLDLEGHAYALSADAY
jgi:hypothetical protein